MSLNKKNQNDILKYLGIKYKFSDISINRLNIKPEGEDKFSKIQRLKNKIEEIENCELKNFANNMVFSDGNYNSPLMIVGEAPGQKEDQLGKPFVGNAGKLLDKMLNAINIKRENVYITNVVNYRPPNNRKPENEEIKRYSKFIKEHIYLIDPQLLILMGSTAMETLLGEKLKITKERGLWKDLSLNDKNFKTIITFHPAYLLRNPEKKKFSWEDLKKIRTEIDKLGIMI